MCKSYGLMLTLDIGQNEPHRLAVAVEIHSGLSVSNISFTVGCNAGQTQ